jgi:hypothetical protein
VHLKFLLWVKVSLPDAINGTRCSIDGRGAREC